MNQDIEDDFLLDKLNENNNNKVSVSTQTDPNLIDKLIDNHVKKQLDDIDLYQEYVRNAQCAQFWPLDKNPIRSLVPAMINVDLPEQYLKNESLMFDLVQAITNNSKLVNLLAKYIHHIVPNVIISKRIDLIPLITCTIRVCRDTNEQERLISLLFNLIKRPNEEQRRMILSGIIVVLQVSPDQSSSLLLPNLWDHVNDKFPERRILLAESCSTLAHYVRPIMRTNLVLSILIQLLKDKNAAVRSAACKSFACLLTLIMDRNDEVFDACLSATEDIIQDVLQQTPVNFCEYRYELEQMRYCALETVYPLLCMWSVKLNRFKIDIAEFYLAKAEKYSQNILNQQVQQQNLSSSSSTNQTQDYSKTPSNLIFNNNSKSSSSSYILTSRRHSSYVGTINNNNGNNNNNNQIVDVATNSAMLTWQRAISAYMKMLNYLIPFVFSDAVNGCAWLSKSNSQYNSTTILFDRPINYVNKLLDPTLIIDESAIVAFHDQLEQEHMIESLDWILNSFLPKFLSIISHFSSKKLLPTLSGLPSSSLINNNNISDINNNNKSSKSLDLIHEFLITTISSTRELCLLFGKHLTRNKIRPLIKTKLLKENSPTLYSIYIASLTSFEPIEQLEFEEIVTSIRGILNVSDLTKNDVEILAITIKIIATCDEQIQSPSTRQKFLTYVLDALVNSSNKIVRTNSVNNNNTSASSWGLKEFMLIIFRNILTCLIDPLVRPQDWAHILVTKFLPLLISLANDSTDVYVCTCARLMCAQLVETFDNYLNNPKMNEELANSILPALNSLKLLTEQIKASNLKRQIECLSQDLNEKFFKKDENNNTVPPPI